MKGSIYKEMDFFQLNVAYNNVKAIDDFDEVMRIFHEKSNLVYTTNSWIRNLKYGRRPRECYDFLSCGNPDAPTYIFIHGGYWSNCCKEDFAFISEGPLAHGMNVILAEYTLTPQITMTEIVAEIGQLLEHLTDDRDNLGIIGKPFFLSGHSAGGHLAAMYRSHPAVSKVHMISALVDLEPISLCWLQDNLKLTPYEIMDLSPLLHVVKGAPTLIAVGAGELSELVRQSTEYAIVCEKNNEHIGHIHIPCATHFTMLDDLANPDGWQMKLLTSL